MVTFRNLYRIEQFSSTCRTESVTMMGHQLSDVVCSIELVLLIIARVLCFVLS